MEIIKTYFGMKPDFTEKSFLSEMIASALASAEKKGREKTWRETKWVNVVWNEAIVKAAKVAEELDALDAGANWEDADSIALGVQKFIAESINKLKRG